MHVAVQSGRPYICYLLLQHGANLTMQNMRKETPADLTADKKILRAMQIIPVENGGQELTKDFIDELEKEEAEKDKYAVSIKKKRVSTSTERKYTTLQHNRKSLRGPAIQRSKAPRSGILKSPPKVKVFVDTIIPLKSVV